MYDCSAGEDSNTGNNLGNGFYLGGGDGQAPFVLHLVEIDFNFRDVIFDDRVSERLNVTAFGCSAGTVNEGATADQHDCSSMACSMRDFSAADPDFAPAVPCAHKIFPKCPCTTCAVDTFTPNASSWNHACEACPVAKFTTDADPKVREPADHDGVGDCLFAPSPLPTITPVPTATFDPTTLPTISVVPSPVPSPAPTIQPTPKPTYTVAPSHVPTVAPCPDGSKLSDGTSFAVCEPWYDEIVSRRAATSQVASRMHSFSPLLLVLHSSPLSQRTWPLQELQRFVDCGGLEP